MKIKKQSMKITESDIRTMVQKVLKESVWYGADPLTKAKELANDGERAIEILQEKVKQLEYIPTVFKSVDSDIKNIFNGIRGPEYDGMYYVYTFAQPLQYNEETDSYGGVKGNIEDIIKDLFPDWMKDILSIYLDYGKNNNADIIYGIKITIDVDNFYQGILDDEF